MKYLQRSVYNLLQIFTSKENRKKDKNHGVAIDINPLSTNWYMQKWVWISSLTIFIILLTLLLTIGKKVYS